MSNGAKKILAPRKFWLIILALIGVGLFIYFFLLIPPTKIPKEREEELPEEIKADKIPPSTAIISPEDKSWWNQDFEVLIEDSDLGSGLVEFLPREKGCRYIIEDLGNKSAIGGFRECDPVKIFVPVGEEKTCSSSYQKENPSQGKCKFSTKAFDRAGNESGWKSKVFNIDLIKPKVGAISPVAIELNKTKTYSVSISDNSKIIGCWFYVNEKGVEVLPKVDPIPCGNDEECLVSVDYRFEKEGEYFVRFSCQDIAGNLGFGEPQVVKVITNHPPKISSCKVNPVKGSLKTEFQFQVEALDPDGDPLFFIWDFGDGKKSNEQNPKHQYSTSGTFEPKVIVSDGKGGTANCSTAWVTIFGE